ncbi:MerR family transcriptional regulator [Arenimonas donghaensis]|uniref:HTH merR-type domain-containing protein n=1 Tax=Arenimonas donghaensis DSM 18148 = HO3-R19 TaxID=1121014 RepID=A0A087MJ89_9GAMM|nr:MerR family transcriptional regulator [Arenimonas donghaensis]KFL36942.1 hypothetical protein N788_11895 [Arenimonas donghaensis DSM 18148 = HO3-R19]
MRHSSPLDIGEAARRLGVSPATLRLYERRGLLPGAARSAAGYRKYSSADMQRARLVCRARRLGLSMDQIAKANRGDGDLVGLRDILRQHLDHLDREIQRGARLRRHLGRWLDGSGR